MGLLPLLFQWQGSFCSPWMAFPPQSVLEAQFSLCSTTKDIYGLARTSVGIGMAIGIGYPESPLSLGP